MKRFSIWMLGAALATLVSPPAAVWAQQARNYCKFNGVTYCDGCVIDRTIQVRAGSSCIVKSNPGNGALLGIDFPVRPKAGRVGQANAYTYAYQAPVQPGEDYFENVIRWQVGITPQSVRIRNHVTIIAAPR